MLEAQFVDFICQASFGVIANSIKRKFKKNKLRKKIETFAKVEFDSKFKHLDLSSEIDFGGLSVYLKSSLLQEIESYITTSNDNIKRTLIAKACSVAKANTRSKEAVVTAFIEGIIVIMKQDFIAEIDNGFKVFSHELMSGLFCDIKGEISKSTNAIMAEINDLSSISKAIVSNFDGQARQTEELLASQARIEQALLQKTEEFTASGGNATNPLDLLRDFGVSVEGDSAVAMAVKYSAKNKDEVISIRFCVKKEGRIAKFNTSDEYLANLNYTMVSDTVDVISTTIKKNGEKEEHCYDESYTGTTCHLPWLSFTEMEIYSSGLNRFTDSQCVSSTLTIVPRQIKATYNIENSDREVLWHSVKYKLRRAVEDNYRCCYYENEVSDRKIKIDLKFALEVIQEIGDDIMVNPTPIINVSIMPLDRFNARSQLEYCQALLKFHSTNTLRFVDVNTHKVDFSSGVKVNGFSVDVIKSLIEMYKIIIDIEEHFNVVFKLEFPIDNDLWSRIIMIHDLIKSKKFVASYSSITLTTHLETVEMKVGTSYGWAAQATINKQLFDKELPIDNVVMVCPNTKYVSQDGDSAVLEVVGDTIYFWDTEDRIFSNLNMDFDKKINFNKMLDIVNK